MENWEIIYQNEDINNQLLNLFHFIPNILDKFVNDQQWLISNTYRIASFVNNIMDYKDIAIEIIYESSWDFSFDL